jgi:AcrR family transcriptional regulator
VTRGALYHHFDSKAEIYGALLAERWASIMAPLWAHLAGDAPPGARLRSFLVAYFRAVEGDLRVRALLEMTMLGGGERAAELSAGLQTKRDALEAWAGALEPLLRDSGASARGRSKDSARLRAAAVVAYVNGITLTWLLCPTLVSPAKDAERLADACLDGVMEEGREKSGRKSSS